MRQKKTMREKLKDYKIKYRRLNIRKKIKKIYETKQIIRQYEKVSKLSETSKNYLKVMT